MTIHDWIPIVAWAAVIGFCLGKFVGTGKK